MKIVYTTHDKVDRYMTAIPIVNPKNLMIFNIIVDTLNQGQYPIVHILGFNYGPKSEKEEILHSRLQYWLYNFHHK